MLVGELLNMPLWVCCCVCILFCRSNGYLLRLIGLSMKQIKSVSLVTVAQLSFLDWWTVKTACGDYSILSFSGNALCQWKTKQKQKYINNFSSLWTYHKEENDFKLSNLLAKVQSNMILFNNKYSALIFVIFMISLYECDCY